MYGNHATAWMLSFLKRSSMERISALLSNSALLECLRQNIIWATSIPAPSGVFGSLQSRWQRRIATIATTIGVYHWLFWADQSKLTVHGPCLCGMSFLWQRRNSVFMRLQCQDSIASATYCITATQLYSYNAKVALVPNQMQNFNKGRG